MLWDQLELGCYFILRKKVGFKTMPKKDPTIIGWREYVDLPEWGIKHLKAKIDTGAKSCSLHGDEIKILGEDKISFRVVLGKGKLSKRIVTSIVKEGKVKSSIGKRTHRWYVQTMLKIGHIRREVKINLSDRGEMNFRMLIGRTALDEDFIVDVAHGYLLGKNLIVKKESKKGKE